MTKYQQYVQDMFDSHKELFLAFEKLHKDYEQDEKQFQKEFNEIGQEVLTVIRKYENMLCAKSEGGKYGKYSGKLAEKFWEALRIRFPKIDFIGIE